ncbi:phosphoglycerate dehydrogenase [Haloglycomyces albus]|uniref:phosphoglycerate dehydrogenase n=1 Tax=Haloglycomyces albus TaxID=526067 RepID=UPI00046D680C|nr:phosphoglycerate dehydrogenase [Haloglycomyces albus]
MVEVQPTVVIADPLADSAVDVLSRDFNIRTIDGTDVATLHSALADAEAVVVRSATTIDAAALEAAPKLKVVARAGVGLDNVAVSEATERGVMVVNAPTSNIVSAAEQAITLLLASARHTSVASRSLREGRWDRKKFTGVEVRGKTVGVVGLGKIGQLVAARMKAFDTEIVAYDPYVQPSRAAQMGIKLMSLEEVLAVSDFVTVHLPKTPETAGLIAKDELARMKPGARIINAARGGLIDEAALYDALQSGHLAAAGLDVFATEPCTDSPLFELDNVVATPHLGASTREAQDNAGLAVAKSVSLALAGEFVPDAVNVQAGGIVDEDVRPYLTLAERLGRTVTAVCDGALQSVTVEVEGPITASDVSVLQLAASKGLFSAVADSVTYVNAPLVAKQRGVDVGLRVNADSPALQNTVTLRGALVDGQAVSVSGTVAGIGDEQPKLLEVNGFDLDIDAAGALLFLSYNDHPGVVGLIGGTLGDLEINIGSMQVSRKAAGGEAFMVMTTDAEVPADVAAHIQRTVGADAAAAVTLED